MFDYDYLETFNKRGGENPLYRLAPDLRAWISQELEKRRTALCLERGPEVKILLTMRSFRKAPVFLLGLPGEEADTTRVLEAWYFHMVPPPPEQEGAVQLVLDRVVLSQIFPAEGLNSQG